MGERGGVGRKSLSNFVFVKHKDTKSSGAQYLILAVLCPVFAATRGLIIKACLCSMLFVYLCFRNTVYFSDLSMSEIDA